VKTADIDSTAAHLTMNFEVHALRDARDWALFSRDPKTLELTDTGERFLKRPDAIKAGHALGKGDPCKTCGKPLTHEIQTRRGIAYVPPFCTNYCDDIGE